MTTFNELYIVMEDDLGDGFELLSSGPIAVFSNKEDAESYAEFKAFDQDPEDPNERRFRVAWADFCS